jgi:hypothetical protein
MHRFESNRKDGSRSVCVIGFMQLLAIAIFRFWQIAAQF